ncbi:DTW domain-containing protein 2 [Sciurus carolinensis]|uniref:tRNA-uridine aminocarboxypropyltransferase n=1 Tax=Sciurus carolinensis TaxID=30640 RepID=A0AA41SUN5_SCICA|nr:DTW domain-containing protein 2 [Sciurus carolinensis]
MEPQKEARTTPALVARPPGASRSQTLSEEERREGGASLVASTLDAEADSASAEGLWELPVEPAERRPECSRCSRPQKVCLCPFLPVHPLHISTHLYIIQHPAEENKVLRTVPLLAACLPQDKCKVKIGRRFSEERTARPKWALADPVTLPLIWVSYTTGSAMLQSQEFSAAPIFRDTTSSTQRSDPEKQQQDGSHQHSQQ